MKSLSCIFSLIGCFLPIFVTVFVVRTEAQLVCSQIHSRPSIYLSTSEPLTNMSLFNSALIDTLRNKSKELDVQGLQSQMQKLEELVKLYLRAAKIEFTESPENLVIRGLKDADLYNLTYRAFILKGSEYGDENSRMIFSVQSNPRLKVVQPVFVFDPLLAIRTPKFLGFFLPRSNLIVVGSDSFQYSRIGVHYNLRHEIQHYFEFVKAGEIKPTLSRLSMTQDHPDGRKPYAEFVSLDELEAHIRELRMLSNKNLAEAEEVKSSRAGFSREKLSRLGDVRTIVIAEKFEIVSTLIENFRSMNKKIRDRVAKGDWNLQSDDLQRQTVIKLSFPGEQPYSEVAINVKGILKPSDNEKKELVAGAVTDLLNQIESRVNLIENELPGIARRAFKLNE